MPVINHLVDDLHKRLNELENLYSTVKKDPGQNKMIYFRNEKPKKLCMISEKYFKIVEKSHFFLIMAKWLFSTIMKYFTKTISSFVPNLITSKRFGKILKLRGLKTFEVLQTFLT